MRKFLIASAVVTVSLVIAAIALASGTQRTYTQTFGSSATGKSTTKTNAATATYFEEHSEDPTNTANNKQPQSDKEVDVIFPKGSKIDTSVPKSCTATDQDFMQKSTDACSKKSLVGNGHALVRTRFNGTHDVPATVTAFNCKKGCYKPAGSDVKTKNQIILYVNPQGVNPVFIRGTIAGKVGKNQKIVAPIPVICTFGTPPNCGSAGESRIVELDLTINKIKKKVKKHKKAFLTTPKKCPSSGLWKFTILFKARSAPDTNQSVDSSAPCKK